MKPKFKIVYICLVAGIVLFGWGVCARLGQAGAIVMPPPTPNTSPGADNTLQIKHIISYRRLSSACGAGGCYIEPTGEIVTIGRYLGGFMGSWRNCDNWKVEDDKVTMTCTDMGGYGKFVSAFGILITNEQSGSPSFGKLQVLMPLSGEDVQLRSIPNVNVPDDWYGKMMWTLWDVEVTPQGAGEDPSLTYIYKWAGFAGGGCINSPKGLCGRVALEHNFRLSP